MPRNRWTKLALSIPFLVLLIALDAVSVLQGLPMLLLGIFVAFLIGNSIRLWLQARERHGLALLPFMTAALILGLAFCRDRNLSQALLFLITLGVVSDVLLLALAGIAEAGKRGLRGLVEFLGATAVGLLMGLAISLIFLIAPGSPGSSSLAGP